jgi:hypothetical protein
MGIVSKELKGDRPIAVRRLEHLESLLAVMDSRMGVYHLEEAELCAVLAGYQPEREICAARHRREQNLRIDLIGSYC